MQLGIFNSIFQLRTIILFVPTTLASVALPMMASFSSTKNYVDFNKVFKYFFFIAFAIGLLTNLFMLLFADLIIDFYGKEFNISKSLIIVIASTSFLASIQLPFGVFINSIGRMWVGFGMNLLWGVILVIVLMLLLRIDASQSALQLAWSYFIAYCILGCALVYYVYHTNRSFKSNM